MSVIGSEILAGASGNQGYFIQKSLRFRSSASAYLNRTPASNGNRKTFTWSGWVKRGSLSTNNVLFSAGLISGTYYYSRLYFDSNNNLVFISYPDTASIQATTSAVYRDPSAWYHIVLAVDTTQATNSNGIKIWVNGVQQTLTFASYTQNADTMFNATSYTDWIGKFVTGGAGDYFDGYLTEVNFIDGQALTPSSFGEYSTQTGVWQAKKYSGTYGTNGFYLPFTDNSALTSGSNAGLGKDFSGNGNYWNTNNISLTSGSTYDSMTDVPTVGELASNYATLSPLNPLGSAAVLSNANLTSSYASTTAGQNRYGTIGMSSGKWYWEVTNTTITSSSTPVLIGVFREGFINGNTDSGLYGYLSSTGNKSDYGTLSAYGASYGTGDIIGVALDLDNGNITFYKNNVSQGVAFSGASGTFFAGHRHANSTGTTSLNYNFGQRPFAYTPPTGFVALNTYNLPTPTIGATASTQANKYFDATLYTGNGGNQTITNSGGFQPDLFWGKSRSAVNNHGIVDSVRGGIAALYSNLTNAEGADGIVNSWNSNGVSLGNSATTNNNGTTYVGWQWRANGTPAVTNTSGSITSTVSANTTSGFSIVTYTGGGTGGLTVGHGLGVAPKMIIVKSRTSTNVWSVYHASLGNTKYMLLNSTDASATSSGFWNNTTPSSTVFTVGTDFAVNQGSINFVAYCFSEVAGFSKFGSYTGNGSSDGPFVYTGFRPKFVMIKRTDSTGYWQVLDTSRSSYNVENATLYPNASLAEDLTNTNLDGLSNGFKIRGTPSTDFNTNGSTYIYACFAENPYKYSLAR